MRSPVKQSLFDLSCWSSATLARQSSTAEEYIISESAESLHSASYHIFYNPFAADDLSPSDIGRLGSSVRIAGHCSPLSITTLRGAWCLCDDPRGYATLGQALSQACNDSITRTQKRFCRGCNLRPITHGDTVNHIRGRARLPTIVTSHLDDYSAQFLWPPAVSDTRRWCRDVRFRPRMSKLKFWISVPG